MASSIPEIEVANHADPLGRSAKTTKATPSTPSSTIGWAPGFSKRCICGPFAEQVEIKIGQDRRGEILDLDLALDEPNQRHRRLLRTRRERPCRRRTTDRG